MTTCSRIELLRCVPGLAEASDEFLDGLSALIEERAVPAGSVLTHEASPKADVCFIVEGRASIRRDGTQVGAAGPGELVAHLAVMDEGVETATVVALTPMRLLVIDAAGWNRLLTQPAVVRELVGAMHARWRRAAARKTEAGALW